MPIIPGINIYTASRIVAELSTQSTPLSGLVGNITPVKTLSWSSGALRNLPSRSRTPGLLSMDHSIVTK
ncbi:hypothetical protein BDV38DRAFT_232355 [Aspergillus pseudotamarii]|uniref:Uncharacterized protein n=1 Tax=Aspergillus pseudotamarii TaxID=132259 RepID=A0A5N6TC95_ASPPS|nr:uncharacterized protein BDV38DRAFT_232355 [Aspergillus pseudotamarii]KAE8143926.1 hypothetical protein BDV38DRAFT_232355 [Aspergillus pseudotamarii]